MDLNNLQLTARTIRELYKDTIIDTVELPASGATTAGKAVTSLGKNKQNIVFLVRDEDNAFCGDEEMNMLMNLLGACKLTMDDIALVNFASNKVSHEQLLMQFKNRVIICFGVTCPELQLPFKIPDFQPYSFKDCQWLFIPSVHDFPHNAGLKRNLWGSLKTIFAL